MLINVVAECEQLIALTLLLFTLIRVYFAFLIDMSRRSASGGGHLGGD